MREYLKFYIDGQWVDPVEPKSLDVDNPTTEQVSGKIALGAAADVDKAVEGRAEGLRHLVGDEPRGAPRRAARRSRPSTRSAPDDLGRRGDRGNGRAALAGGAASRSPSASAIWRRRSMCSRT